MTAFNTAAKEAQDQAKRNFDINGTRDDGVSVGVCFGVGGGLLGGAAALAQGAPVLAAVIGGGAGAAVGYAIGNIFRSAELFGTTGKIINSAAAGLTGASTAIAVAELMSAFGSIGGDAAQ